MTNPKRKRRYDYVAQSVIAADTDFAFSGTRVEHERIRRLLRRLVREAVQRAGECGKHEAIDRDLAQRIAREVVP